MKRQIALLTILLLFPLWMPQATAWTLPKGVERIEAEAFRGAKADSVELYRGIRRIESRAFADCTINCLVLPDSIEYVAEDAFENAEIEMAYASEDSVAGLFCSAHNIPVSPWRFTVVLCGDGEGEKLTLTQEPGEWLTLPPQTEVRTDALFIGWNTREDGSGACFADEATLALRAGETLTLYALWMKAETIEARNARMLRNLEKSTVLGGKKESILSMGQVLLDAGFEPSFVAGAMANIFYEGACGVFENSTYTTHPEKKPAYLIYMDEHWDYNTRYSKKNVYDPDISLKALKQMHDALAADGYPGKFGLGAMQWTGVRCAALIGVYLEEAGKSDHITKEQTCLAEGKMVLGELKGSYRSVYTNWRTANAAALRSSLAAYDGGYRFCSHYEKPAGGETSAKTRGSKAQAIYAVMGEDYTANTIVFTANRAKTSGKVYVRNAPSLDGKALETLDSGVTVVLTGEAAVDDRGVAWYEIRINGLTGWSSSKYLTVGGSL